MSKITFLCVFLVFISFLAVAHRGVSSTDGDYAAKKELSDFPRGISKFEVDGEELYCHVNSARFEYHFGNTDANGELSNLPEGVEKRDIDGEALYCSSDLDAMYSAYKDQDGNFRTGSGRGGRGGRHGHLGWRDKDSGSLDRSR